MTKEAVKWYGQDVLKKIVEKTDVFLVHFGHAAEQAAKQELQPGRGVDTGSMKRGIHLAPGDYDFTRDHDYPNGPERGLQRVTPTWSTKTKRTVALGSGQRYSIYQHQGTEGGITALRYITRGFVRVRSMVARSLAGR